MSDALGPPSESAWRTGNRRPDPGLTPSPRPGAHHRPRGEGSILELEPGDVQLLRDAVAMWLANWLTSVPVDLHDEQRAPFDAMVEVGRKLGLNL